MNRSNCITFPFPLERVHLGMPMSNSRLGALVFGSGNTLEICLSESSNWDHRNGEKFWTSCPYDELVGLFDKYDVAPINRRLEKSAIKKHYAPGETWWPSRRLGGGRMKLELGGDLRDITLHYSDGRVTIRTTGGHLELHMSLSSNDLLILDPHHLIRRVTAHPMWDKLGTFFQAAGYLPPERFESDDETGFFQMCPDDPGLDLRCRKTRYGRVIQGVLRNHAGASELPDRKKVQADNSAFWKRYWSSITEISLPDDFFNCFFRFAQYKFATATMPGGVPAGLQGPYVEDYQLPPWSADYHFNVNIQQIYTFAFSQGKFDHVLPLFDMLESAPFQSVMRGNAKALFGIDDGLLLTHAVDDRGMQCGGMGVGAALDMVCGGWMGMLYYDYYRYSGDLDFLRNRAWPMMCGFMRTLESALRLENQHYVMPLGISAEYGCIFPVKIDGKMCRQNSGRNPSNALSCIHALLNALRDCANALGTELPEKWLDIKEKLPKFTDDGNKVIIWEGQDLDVCHRHHSHLSMIYPFDLTGVLTEEETQKVDNAVEHWIWRGMGQWSEWCYPWAIMIQTRWGMSESPVQLLNLWKSLFINSSMATVYLPKFRGLSSHRKDDMLKPKIDHEIIQLDGTMAGATALTELLVHMRGETVRLFAGIPEEWGDVSFSRVHLPGQLCVSATMKNHKVVDCSFVAPEKKDLRVEFPGGVIKTVTTKKG